MSPDASEAGPERPTPVKPLPGELDTDNGSSPPAAIELRALAIVASFAPREGAGCPKIAHELNEPEQLVRAAVDALVETGAVTRDERSGHVLATEFGRDSLAGDTTELRLRLVERRSELAEDRHRREVEALLRIHAPRRADRPTWREDRPSLRVVRTRGGPRRG